MFFGIRASFVVVICGEFWVGTVRDKGGGDVERHGRRDVGCARDARKQAERIWRERDSGDWTSVPRK